MKIQNYVFSRIFTCFFIGCFIFSFAGLSAAAPQKNVGILVFKNLTTRHGLEQPLMSSLLSEISKNASLHIIDRINLDQILNEQGLSRTGIISKDSAVQMGRINGINYLLTGTILETNPALPTKHNMPMVGVSIFWEILDTTSGMVIFADTITGTANKVLVKGKDKQKTWMIPPTAYAEAVGDGSKKICAALDKKLNTPPLAAHIASIYGNTIYIDIGANRQVMAGQIFTVYKEGQPIRHPITGEVLGTQRKLVCRIMLNNIENKLASGVVIEGDLYNVRIGDHAVRQ
jgi:Curli production assembly/transport component CsgG.